MKRGAKRMKQSNTDFICKCGLCGHKELALSELILKIGYGSDYDGELIEAYICGKCADRLYELLSN